MTYETATDDEVRSIVRRGFADSKIKITAMSIRRFPGETIVIVEVSPSDFDAALGVASELDARIPSGFVTVRRSSQEAPRSDFPPSHSLVDPRINSLVEILNSRSRTSEKQPSLHYVPDTAQNLNIAMSQRNHLIFGRRGVGKTALMLETKKALDRRGALTFWINIQVLRSLSADEAFLTIAARICELPEIVHTGRKQPPLSVARAAGQKTRIKAILEKPKIPPRDVNLLLPELQQVLGLLCQETQEDIFLFLDDLHYLSMKEQPRFLDLVHSITRDNPAWIKAAGIKHQMRWFVDNPPTGLQTGHDAATINLDVTLEQPAKAKEFLSSILKSYTDDSNLKSPSAAVSTGALDRLVLASGGVPRDFLTLTATAIQVARQRANAKAAGVQDVNEAAGRIAKIKMQELEDDAASSVGETETRIKALNRLRRFLLEEKQVTYFRVDLHDKEENLSEYDLLQSLMDLRLIHLINASLSDEHHAGRRSEVYMLDLSEFSGMRFKRNLKVLDLFKGFLVLKSTGGQASPRPGDTPKKLQGILRRGPVFELSEFTEIAQAA